MKSLSERLAEANTLLAPYAVPHDGLLGRVVSEQPDATRFPFQRDRDRIIHSTAFRRLKGKTQVFVAGVGDHYRTRLTHTMEVAQISRDMARTLSLNEDLAECIALAHDLGHPPFGHAGEDALDAWMRTHGSSFEHNRQSLRIVTVLENLNMNKEVTEGMHKHRTPFDGDEHAKQSRGLSLEAQVVNIADEIAYMGHDTDDGLRANLFTLEEISAVPLIASALKEAANSRSLRSALIHIMVLSVYEETERRLQEYGIGTLEDVYAHHTDIVAFSPVLRTELDALRTFLWNNMYMHPSVLSRAEEGKRILRERCDALLQNPSDKVLALQEAHGCSLAEAVKDYVAGMTDGYVGAGG